jgi:hypothetical protein
VGMREERGLGLWLHIFLSVSVSFISLNKTCLLLNSTVLHLIVQLEHHAPLQRLGARRHGRVYRSIVHQHTSGLHLRTEDRRGEERRQLEMRQEIKRKEKRRSKQIGGQGRTGESRTGQERRGECARQDRTGESAGQERV